MNYQQLDTQPFVPSQAGQRAAALRRRLMGPVTKVAPKPPKRIEKPKSKPVWFGVQHDDHVHVWDEHQKHLERMRNYQGEPIETLYRIIVPMKRTKRQITMEVLKDHPGVKFSDLIGPSRRDQFVIARHEAMYAIWNELRISFPSIGLFFGGRDHTTVLYAVKKIERMKHAK